MILCHIVYCFDSAVLGCVTRYAWTFSLETKIART